MSVDLGIRSERGMSKVLGVVLLIAIVLLLTVTVGSMALTFAEQKPEEPSLPAVTFDESRFNVDMTAHSSLDAGDTLQIKVNGETRKVWKDYSAGESKSIQCVGPDDTISIVSAGTDNSYTVNEHQVSQRTDCRFEVNVAGESPTTVSPIGWQQDSDEFDDFYSYAHAHAHLDPSSPIIQRDTSYMFFYEYNGQVALVLVHDLPQEHGSPGGGNDHSDIPAVGQPRYEYNGPSDEGGGAVDMVFHGLPEGGSWVMKDDPHDWTYPDGSHRSGHSPSSTPRCDAVENRVCWSWASRNTDGGIYAGGFNDPDAVDITIEANWNDPTDPDDTIADGNWNEHRPIDQVDEWKFLYATEDGIRAIDLDKDKDVHIEGLEGSP